MAAPGQAQADSADLEWVARLAPNLIFTQESARRCLDDVRNSPATADYRHRSVLEYPIARKPASSQKANMVQVKKDDVRLAITRSAFRLFKSKGYVGTTTAAIARGAKVSEANLYKYFRSKFAILFALYEPWLRERFDALEASLAADRNPRNRVRCVLRALWIEIPLDDNGFTNNLMQALASARSSDGYKPDLLNWAEGRIEALLLATLPAQRRSRLTRGKLAHILMMAQDGFAMSAHLPSSRPCTEASIEMMCDLICGTKY